MQRDRTADRDDIGRIIVRRGMEMDRGDGDLEVRQALAVALALPEDGKVIACG